MTGRVEKALRHDAAARLALEEATRLAEPLAKNVELPSCACRPKRTRRTKRPYDRRGALPVAAACAGNLGLVDAGPSPMGGGAADGSHSARRDLPEPVTGGLTPSCQVAHVAVLHPASELSG